MNFEFELTTHDLKAFNRVVSRRIAERAKLKSKLFIFNIVAWIPFGIAAASFLGLYGKHRSLTSELNTVLIAAGVAVVLIWASSVYRRKLVENVLCSNEYFRVKQSVTADSAGVQIVAGDAASQCAWSSFVDYYEDDGTIHLFMNVSHAVIVPKRVFHSPDELAQFRDLAQGSIKRLQATI